MAEDTGSFRTDEILAELRQNREENSLKIYQKILSCNFNGTAGKWQLILQELLDQIAVSTERNQRVLLTSQLFFVIFSKTSTNSELQQHLEDILNLSGEKLITLSREFVIADIEFFKLNSIHGYLAAKCENIYSPKLLTQCLDHISPHCMTYTRHVYSAFKILILWLERSRDVDVWRNNEIENKLEAIIFSNWDNSIFDVTRINVSFVFSMYLLIMQEKYPGFLDYTFRVCMENLSWMTTTKHLILAEICRRWDGLPSFTDQEIQSLFRSLAETHLKHATTKLYIALLDKMTCEGWMSMIMRHVMFYAKKWETEKNISTLQLLWELWMKPTMKKFKENLVIELGPLFKDPQLPVCQSYLGRYCAELGINWICWSTFASNSNSTDEIQRKNVGYWSCDATTGMPPIIDHAEECVRLNVFIMLCRTSDFTCENLYLYQNWLLPQHFLYYNRNAPTSELRKGICDGISALLRSAGTTSRHSSNTLKSLYDFLRVFMVDVFEPGTSYQQRILTLKLFEIILQRDDWKQYFDNQSVFQTLKVFLNDPVEEINTLAYNLIKKYVLVVVTDREMVPNAFRQAENQLPGAGKLLQLCANTDYFSKQSLHDMLTDYAIHSFTVAKKKTRNFY